MDSIQRIWVQRRDEWKCGRFTSFLRSGGRYNILDDSTPKNKYRKNDRDKKLSLSSKVNK